MTSAAVASIGAPNSPSTTRLLPIVEFPDPRLHRASAPVPVERIDDALRGLADDMLATMYAARSIGLAAIQVGVPSRLLVADVSEAQDAPLVLVNPEVVSRSLPGMSEESCLSVPGFVAAVARHLRVTVRALDRQGAPLVVEAEGLLAVCLQHEIDHLDGRLFVDRLPWLSRWRARRSLRAGRPSQVAAGASPGGG